MVSTQVSRCRLLAFVIPPRVIRLAAIPVVYESLNGHTTWNLSPVMLSAVPTVSLFAQCNRQLLLSCHHCQPMNKSHPSLPIQRTVTTSRISISLWKATCSNRYANGHSRTIHIDPRPRPLGWSKQASSVAMLAIGSSASIAIWSVSNGHCRAMIPGRYTAHSRPSVRTSWPSKLNRDRRRFRSSTIKDRQQQTEVTRCGWATSYTGLHVIRTLSIFQDVRLRFRHGQRRTCPRWMFLFERAFFYTGTKSIVTCFYCNGSLQNWGAGDNPMVEHARWFPQCAYAKQLCGADLYRRIRESSKRQQGNERFKLKSTTDIFLI